MKYTRNYVVPNFQSLERFYWIITHHEKCRHCFFNGNHKFSLGDVDNRYKVNVESTIKSELEFLEGVAYQMNHL